MHFINSHQMGVCVHVQPPEQRGPSELWGDWLQSDEPSASDVRWSCQGSQNLKELFQQMYKCKSTGVIYFPAICVPEVPPSSRSVHRVILLTWDWHLRWAVQLKEILMTSVWFVHFSTISVQFNSLRSQTMSQSVNRWRCGVHTHPRRVVLLYWHHKQDELAQPLIFIVQCPLSQRNLFYFDMLIVSEDLVSLASSEF